MANTYANILKAGLQASYNSLEVKDPNSLYFCTDTGKIYKGTVDMSDSSVVAASKPATPIVGKVYFLADTNTVEIYTGSGWKVISYPTVTTVSASSDDVHVATAKAVYDAIQDAVADVAGSATTIKTLTAAETDGHVTITKGDDSTTDLALNGVVTTPTWDAAARKLTMPVVGGSDVVVNIGKDIFIDPEAVNGYNEETQTIDVYLNDGTGEGDGTKISIPAAALVDVYTGTTANGTSTTVSDGNVISVNLVVDPDEKNGLVVTANGIMVDTSAFAVDATIQQQISALQDDVDAAQGDATNALGQLEVLNGNAMTEGSVAKAVADAQATLQSNIDGVAARVTTLEGQMTTAQANIAANTENIAALSAAVTGWGTF